MPALVANRILRTHFHVVARRPKPAYRGTVMAARAKGLPVPDWMTYVLWEDDFSNLVVNVGLDDSLDKHLKGSAYTAAWYVMLLDGTPTVIAGDTMVTHAGRAEVTAYDEGTRPVLTLGAVASQSVDNVGNEARFTIDTDDTVIGGAGVTTDNVKAATDGMLYGAGAFTAADKTLDDGDTVDVTCTLTAAAA